MSTIRKIQLSDKKEVLNISSQIWEGDDYVANVFDKWVNSKNGLFVGYWEDERLIGFGRMRYLTPVDIWLEALRKDPKTKLSGIGYKIAKFYMQQLKGRKVRSIRFSTYFGNIASIKLNKKLGFKKVLTLSLKELDISKYVLKPNTLNVIQDVDNQQLYEFMINSAYLRETKNFIGIGWIIHEFNKTKLNEFILNKQYAVYMEDDNIKGAILFSEIEYKKIFWISFIEAGSYQIFCELLDFVMNKALQTKCSKIQILAPDITKLMTNIDSAGFRSWEQNNDVFVYELPKEVISKISGSKIDS